MGRLQAACPFSCAVPRLLTAIFASMLFFGLCETE
jgi:hypothetical protein